MDMVVGAKTPGVFVRFVAFSCAFSTISAGCRGGFNVFAYKRAFFRKMREIPIRPTW